MEMVRKNIFSRIGEILKKAYKRIGEPDIQSNEAKITKENFPNENENVLQELMKSQNEELIEIVNSHSSDYTPTQKQKRKSFEEKYATLYDVVYEQLPEDEKKKMEKEYWDALEKRVEKEQKQR